MKEYQDYYFHKAKTEKYPARSVYKLKELDAKYKLLRKGMKILDLGAAPGSWSLGACEKIGSKGLIVACDIQQTSTIFPPQVIFKLENIFELSNEFQQYLQETGPFDLVMSDMAPLTTGSKFTDQARSFNLAMEALSVSEKYLKVTGNFIVKLFMGPDLDEFKKNMNVIFDNVKIFKPKSSRSESKETFLIGLSRK